MAGAPFTRWSVRKHERGLAVRPDRAPENDGAVLALTDVEADAAVHGMYAVGGTAPDRLRLAAGENRTAAGIVHDPLVPATSARQRVRPVDPRRPAVQGQRAAGPVAMAYAGARFEVRGPHEVARASEADHPVRRRADDPLRTLSDHRRHGPPPPSRGGKTAAGSSVPQAPVPAT